jgi:hypothetical protein
MKPLFILALMLAALPAFPQKPKYTPTSVRDWEAKSDNDQVRYIRNFVGLIAAGEAPGYKVTPEQIRALFIDKVPGHDISEGIMMVLVAIGLLHRAEKTGGADLSKINIEDVVDWAIQMKFEIKLPISARKSAPAKTKPKSPATDDDPIGNGGFITPPQPQRHSP